MIGAGLSIGGVSVRRHAVAAGAPTLEPNVWPQPDFDASTGLTLTNAAVFEGQLLFGAPENGEPQICAMTTPPIFSAGEIWHYSVELMSGNPSAAGFCFLEIGGQSVDLHDPSGGPGIRTGQVTIGGSPVQQLRFRETSSFLLMEATSCTIQRQA